MLSNGTKVPTVSVEGRFARQFGPMANRQVSDPPFAALGRVANAADTGLRRLLTEMMRAF